MNQVEPINGILPLDFNQIPDIFMHIYCNSGGYASNLVGYIRLPAIEVTRKKPQPEWYDVKSPFNDIRSDQLGQVLCNVQFMKNNGQGITRHKLEKGSK